MKGSIDKIWENQTKDNKTFYVLEIGGDKYSVWDPKLVEGLDEGNTIDYQWKQSGNFKKITSLAKIEAEPDLDNYPTDRKSREIVRMSCLRSATELLGPVELEPDDKIEKALDMAKVFERYVVENDENLG